MVLQLKPNFDTSGSHPVGQVSGTPAWYSENLGSFTALIRDYSKWWSSNDKDFLYSVVGNLSSMVQIVLTLRVQDLRGKRLHGAMNTLMMTVIVLPMFTLNWGSWAVIRHQCQWLAIQL